MAYELLSGRFFFPVGTSYSKMRAMLLRDGVSSLQHELDWQLIRRLGPMRRVVKRMLSRDPSARATMREVHDAFKAAADGVVDMSVREYAPDAC